MDDLLFTFRAGLKLEKSKCLSDEFLHHHRKFLCFKCNQHIDIWSHVYSGKELTHLITNQEIDFLTLEMNRDDLLQILKVHCLKLV